MERHINVINLIRDINVAGNSIKVLELAGDPDKGYVYMKLTDGTVIPIRSHLSTMISESHVLEDNGVVIDHKIFNTILNNFVIVEDGSGEYKLDTASIPPDLMTSLNGENVLDIGKCFIYMIAASRAMTDTYNKGVEDLAKVFQNIEDKLDEKIAEAQKIVDTVVDTLDLIQRNTDEHTSLRQGRSCVLRDDKSLPSIMVKIPMFLLSEVFDDVLEGSAEDGPHPAFIVNGKTVSSIYVSKYPNKVIGDRGYSLSGSSPVFTDTFEKAIEVCENKGNGWHLMTNAEWGAIIGLSAKYGTIPLGNTYYGTDFKEKSKSAIMDSSILTTDRHRGFDFDGTNYKNITTTKTGSGPVEYSHDGSSDGVFDLTGNVDEFVGGIRLQNGEVQVIPDNDGAIHGKDQSHISTEWRSISMNNGSYVSSATSGNVYFDLDTARTGVVFNDSRHNISPGGNDSDTGVGTMITTKYSDMPVTTTPNVVTWIGLYSPEIEDQSVSIINTGERIVMRGGCYNSTINNFASIRIRETRDSTSTTDYGFRACYIDPTEYE